MQFEFLVKTDKITEIVEMSFFRVDFTVFKQFWLPNSMIGSELDLWIRQNLIFEKESLDVDYCTYNISGLGGLPVDVGSTSLQG